ERLLAGLRQARWFGGKGRAATLRSLTPLPWLRPPGTWPAVRIELAEIGYPDAPTEYYQLPLAYRPAGADDDGTGGDTGDDTGGDTGDAPVLRRIEDPEHGVLTGTDDTEDAAACTALLGALLAGDRVVEDDHELEFVPEAGAETLSADLPPSRLRAEQSNTSVRYGDRALLKVFRRLELGDNLDITVHRALNRAGTTDAARLYGRVTARWTTGDGGPGGRAELRADLAMLGELFPDAEDGWQLAVAAAESGTDFTAEARRLGAALAEVHAALRDSFGTGTRSGAEIAAGMADRLDRTCAFAPQLRDHADALRARFDRLAGLTLDTQRVHGGFHLGQTLRTGSGWKIIDFEGGPAKTMAERLLPDSRWRDVAGMLRSFDYAVADSAESGPAWAEEAQRAFLDGYTGSAELSPEQRLIVDGYVVDKAIYEI